MGLQPIFLLVIRFYRGWQFFQTGLGKLMDIPKVTAFFESLGNVAPAFNAVLAGCSERFGGLLRLLGLGSRFITIPLLTTMTVAYLTADLDKVKHIFAEPDKFVTAEPFLFLLAALIVFLFGPGPLSLDGMLSRIRSGQHAVSSSHSLQKVVQAFRYRQERRRATNSPVKARTPAKARAAVKVSAFLLRAHLDNAVTEARIPQ